MDVILKNLRASTIIRKDDEVLMNGAWMPVTETQIGQRAGGATIRRLTNHVPRGRKSGSSRSPEFRSEPLRQKFGNWTKVPRAQNYSQLDETGVTFRLLRPEEITQPTDEYISLTNVWAPMHELLIGKQCGGLYVRRKLESYEDVKQKQSFSFEEMLPGDKLTYMGHEAKILTTALEGEFHIGVLCKGQMIQFNKDGARMGMNLPSAPHLINEGGKSANPAQRQLL